MSLNGGWVSFGGDARIELAAGLVAVAGCAAYAGIRLRRPVRAVRPPASVAVLMFSLWVIALIAFAAGLTIYVHQFVHDYPHITSGVSDPIAPVTLLAAAAIFGIIMTRTGWRYQTRLGSAVIGAMAAPMIFELPFDFIVMARTYPALPPDPAFCPGPDHRGRDCALREGQQWQHARQSPRSSQGGDHGRTSDQSCRAAQELR